MKTPVDHIARSHLPWRDEESALTECGLAAVSYPTISREAFFGRLKEFGQQRTALMTCMTCSGTVTRWSTWEEDPIDAVKREVSQHWHGRRSDEGEYLKRDFLAIAYLIREHRIEFDQHMRDLLSVTKLSDARTARQTAPRDKW